MSTLESKPTPSGPKNSNFISQEIRKSKSHTPAGYSNHKKKIAETKIDILDDWDPAQGGFAIHIQFIHQSLMDLAVGIEKVGIVSNKMRIISDEIHVISDQLTIIENHLIKMDKRQNSLEDRLKVIDECQDSLCKGQRSIANRMLKTENIFIDKIDSSNQTRADEDIRSFLSENVTTTNNNLQKMEERLQKEIIDSKNELSNKLVSSTSTALQKMETRLKKKIEDSKVELSTTFETEAEVCRNIYVTEMMNQVSSIKGKGPSVRYVGEKETQTPNLSRLSSILPSFGEEMSPKKPYGVTITSKQEV